MQYYLILIQCPIPFRVSTMVRFPASKSIHNLWSCFWSLLLADLVLLFSVSPLWYRSRSVAADAWSFLRESMAKYVYKIFFTLV